MPSSTARSIYNHEQLRSELAARGPRISSCTDGAVIPHLYEEFGSKLFARLDGVSRWLCGTQARARSCSRAIIWGSSRSMFTVAKRKFGSRPKSRRCWRIRSCRVELDLVALDQHLTYRFTPAPRTLLRCVEKLEPATVLVWRDGNVNTERYWRNGSPAPTALSFRDAADAFRDRLRAAVHRQMMRSDRPIGVMLSGGVDSAAITALMAEQSSQVKTFTVGFEGGGDADETGLARETAQLFGTEHHELIVGDADFAAELPAVIEMLEEPVGASSALGFRAVSRLACEHVPVLLSGQGADELLAGYWRYVGEWLAGIAQRLPGPLSALMPAIATASGRVRSARLERGLRALRHSDVPTRFMDIYAVFTEAQKLELYSP